MPVVGSPADSEKARSWKDAIRGTATAIEAGAGQETRPRTRVETGRMRRGRDAASRARRPSLDDTCHYPAPKLFLRGATHLLKLAIWTGRMRVKSENWPNFNFWLLLRVDATAISTDLDSNQLRFNLNSAILRMAALPPKLSSVLARARELRAHDVVIAYWCTFLPRRRTHRSLTPSNRHLLRRPICNQHP
jgi:hypothetical protein